MIVLISLAILAGLGLLFGIVLAIASKLLAVKEDPRIKEVAKLLPNYNCGACGHAGCIEMAEALVKGEEKVVEKCKPGKKEANFDPIKEYLKSHPTEDGSNDASN